MRYRELYFGISDSRNEASANQYEFVRSYVDIRGICEAVLDGQKFLALGPEGNRTPLAIHPQTPEPKPKSHAREACLLTRSRASP
jgi:hypothetical protein